MGNSDPARSDGGSTIRSMRRTSGVSICSSEPLFVQLTLLLSTLIELDNSRPPLSLQEIPMFKSSLEVAKQADLFFMEASPIHETMRRLARTLGDMQIFFAIAGAMAANSHGHKRTTADVDILIRREDLQRFKKQHIGLGWVDKFEGSRNFRDAVTNVNVDTLIVGEYPGDGLPKPVSFPSPENVSTKNNEGIPIISLPTLLELKLASGMTAPHRPRDLDDVIQLIRIQALSLDYGNTLNPFVQDKYREMWQVAQINEDY